MDENELIEKSQKGDVYAFEELIKPYEAKILNLTFRMLSSNEDAEDVTQEVLVKAFRHIKKFNGNSSFSTWIYKIASNTCMDELRKRKRRGISISINQQNDKDEEYELSLPDTSPTPFEQAKRKEAMQKLNRAINELSDEHRQVITMRDINDMPYEQIAEITGATLGTVKSRLNRARLILRKILENDKELFL